MTLNFHQEILHIQNRLELRTVLIVQRYHSRIFLIHCAWLVKNNSYHFDDADKI